VGVVMVVVAACGCDGEGHVGVVMVVAWGGDDGDGSTEYVGVGGCVVLHVHAHLSMVAHHTTGPERRQPRGGAWPQRRRPGEGHAAQVGGGGIMMCDPSIHMCVYGAPACMCVIIELLKWVVVLS
jgi:hypothetical protein